MPTKPVDRLLFAQGGECFFCKASLDPANASVEHLVAAAKDGSNADENCVVCCKALNHLFGHISLKEKIDIVLKQKGAFKCPNGISKVKTRAGLPADTLDRVVIDLRKRGKSRPASVSTLKSSINNLFQKLLTPRQLESLINELTSKGVLLVDGAKVSYKLPSTTT